MVGTCFQPCLNGVFSQIMFWEKYFGFYFPESPELGEQSLLSLLLKGGSKIMTKKDPHLTLVFLVLSTVEPPTATGEVLLQPSQPPPGSAGGEVGRDD